MNPLATVTTNVQSVLTIALITSVFIFAERYRSATTPAGATRAHARGVTAGVVVL